MLKQVKIDEQLHKRIKVAATLGDTTIKEWVESVLEDALAGRPSPSVLIDSKGRYDAQEESPCTP